MSYPITYTQEYVDDLVSRIAELEAQVEALTPKPVVVSQWANIFVEYPGDWHGTLAAADHYCKSGGDYIGRLRRDKITHPDGRVEYKLEVEK